MTAIKRAQLVRAFDRWDPAIRLLLLAGPDEAASRELAGLALKSLVEAGDPMSLTDLTSDELRSDPGRLADEAASVSMFGSRGSVIRVAPATEATAEAARMLLAAPAAGNPVVMVAGDLSKTSTLRKLAEESPAALILISWPMRQEELAGWLAKTAREQGLGLGPGVAERLAAASGGDTGVIASELVKFALFLDASPAQPARLESAHLSLLGADSADEDMATLVLGVITGEARTVERQLRLLDGTSAIPVLRAVARRLMQLAEARAAFDAGARAEAALKGLRPPIHFSEAPAIAAALPEWPMGRIRAGLAEMLAGERAIKQARGPGDAAGWQRILLLGARRESA